MTNLYLIAHKVRGEPAFDIAERLECSVCHADQADVDFVVSAKAECHECESLGYWWIIPTSGHRAYPYWFWGLEATELSGGTKTLLEIASETPMPPSLPDHYPSTTTPTFTGSLLAKLGLRKRAEPITRRV